MRPSRTPPDDLPPMKVNTVTMVVAGIVVWVGAFVVSLVLEAAGRSVRDGVVEVCLAGIVLGIVALAWAVPQHRREVREEARRRASRERTVPEDPRP